MIFYMFLGMSKDGEVIYICYDNIEKIGMILIVISDFKVVFMFFYFIEEGLEYFVVKYGDDYFILINDNVKNFCIMKVDVVNMLDKSKWQEVIVYDLDVFIQDIELLQDFLVYKVKKDGIFSLNVVFLEIGESYVIFIEDFIYMVYFLGNIQVDINIVCIYYVLFIMLLSMFDINLEIMESMLLK